MYLGHAAGAAEAARQVLHLERGAENPPRCDEEIRADEDALGAQAFAGQRDDAARQPGQACDVPRERLAERDRVPRFRLEAQRSGAEADDERRERCGRDARRRHGATHVDP